MAHKQRKTSETNENKTLFYSSDWQTLWNPNIRNAV